MGRARIDQSLNHRHEERAGATRRLDREHRCQIPVCGVPGEIEDQLDDPAASEDLTVFASFVDLMHVRVHPEPVAEAQLLR
ncbi:MAG: hypothetical protein R2713_10525 [Ilumatobacteraceae bacterium]